MKNWYLACYKPGKINLIKAQYILSNWGVQSFTPLYHCHKQRSDRIGQIRIVIEPLFPGYLFLFFDPGELHTSKIECCPGLSHLVRFANQISPIREQIINEVMAFSTDKVKEYRAKKESRLREKVKQISQIYQGNQRSALFLAFLEEINDRK